MSGSWITLHVESPVLINRLKVAFYSNATTGVFRAQRAAGDVGWILRTGGNRRSPAVITLIYCFIAVRRLLAVDGLHLAACALLMQIIKKKKTKRKLHHHVPHLHRSEVSELI